MKLDDVRDGLTSAGINAELVDELLEAYVETKRRYHLGDLRPQAVEGGRFAEAAFRILQLTTSGKFTPLGKTLPTVDKLLTELQNRQGQADSVRLHIPRTLKLIYDIRNKRDAAHLGDGIDPNLQDASLVVACIDWVMAELVRLHHGVTADQAQAIIADLVGKEVPAIQDIEGQPVILADLKPREQVLLLLYRVGASGATLDDLARWLRLSRKDHLKQRLAALDKGKLVLIHPDSGRFFITDRGIRYVEAERLAQPI